eukprot:CCRYP_004433-RB/>CCRYP_004433-RB protein AED:0.04 eAED:0.04 QI:36/1/0.9/1/0.44/0.3/10/4851/213
MMTFKNLHLFLQSCLLLTATHAFMVPIQNGRAAVVRHLEASSQQLLSEQYLNDEQLAFCKAYLNEHHQSDMLLPFVQAFTDIGTTSARKNLWLANSYSIVDANVTDITSSSIIMDVNIQDGGKTKVERVEVPLDSVPVDGMAKKYKNLPQIDPICLDGTVPIDNFVRRVNRLCNIVKAYGATGKMIQMGVQLGGRGVGRLRDDMYLNQVPHSK